MMPLSPSNKHFLLVSDFADSTCNFHFSTCNFLFNVHFCSFQRAIFSTCTFFNVQFSCFNVQCWVSTCIFVRFNVQFFECAYFSTCNFHVSTCNFFFNVQFLLVSTCDFFQRAIFCSTCIFFFNVQIIFSTCILSTYSTCTFL